MQSLLTSKRLLKSFGGNEGTDRRPRQVKARTAPAHERRAHLSGAEIRPTSVQTLSDDVGIDRERISKLSSRVYGRQSTKRVHGGASNAYTYFARTMI
ncbi:hypothetical protein EVAR_3437_1 [Eumeta japonica]|uniref:Uncharacterized protein n=1 Tax=Eumeta variegata TaxID=151549 RepID=A0A4C1SVP1_EUMVA|nr:hypothetical protein EVAR_3437_1 [Eumeta japonica]